MVLLFSIFIIYPAVTRVPDVRVPDVSNLSVEEAESKLKNAGFEIAVDIEQISSNTIKEGK